MFVQNVSWRTFSEKRRLVDISRGPKGFPSIGGFEPRDHYLCLGDVSGDMRLTVTAFLSYSFCTPECLLGRPLLEGNRWPRVFYLALKA